MMYLVADSRERATIPALEAGFRQAGARLVVEQINTGDYLLCREGTPPELVACIERKTLPDFARSFCDGRYENVKKMVALRAATGCQLYFFVEGQAFPAQNRMFGGVCYLNIARASTHLMLRDGVHVVLTKDVAHTAQRLLEFVQAAERVNSFKHSIASQAGDAELEWHNDLPSQVRGAIRETDDQLCVKMWCKLPNVSMSTAQMLVGEFSVAALLEGSHDLHALRTAAGRKVSLPARASLETLRMGGKTHETRIVEGISGVGRETAIQLLQDRSLASLLGMPAGELADLPIVLKSGNIRRLGRANASKLISLMNYQRLRPAKTQNMAANSCVNS